MGFTKHQPNSNWWLFQAKPASMVREMVGRVESQMSFTSLFVSNVQLTNRLCIWEKQHATCTPEDESTTRTT